MDTPENIYRLAPLQAGMLFHSLRDSDNVRPYVVQIADEFNGPLDEDCLRTTWQRLVNLHTILRSAFIWDGLTEPVQVVQRSAVVPFFERDWRAFGAEVQNRELERLLNEDRRRGFDLAEAPLLRVTVVRLGDERRVILWSFHHLLLDGWSVQLLQKELYATYNATLEGVGAQIDAPVPYSRYIEWLSSQPIDEAEEYWRHNLRGITAPTGLVVDRPTGKKGFGEVTIEIGPSDSQAIRLFAKKQRITANTLLQGVWALLLSRYSGSDDILYGSTVAGRPVSLADAEVMVGMFINTIPVRTRVPDEKSISDWLRNLQTHHAELRLYEHSALVDIHGWSEIPRGIPLFTSIFVFENYPQILSETDFPQGTTCSRLRSVEWADNPVTVRAHLGDRLDVAFSYAASLFDVSTVQRMAGHFQVLLSNVVADPGVRVGGVEMLTEAEKHQLLVEWNDTAADYPYDTCIHQLVEEQAAARPDATAVIFADQELTYSQLNHRANQLAHHLRALGVGPEVLVGVCLERSTEMVVSLLAVLKAGGAYVPLDPDYPADRLAFMMTDTAAPIIITQASLTDKLTGHHAAAVLIDTDWPTITTQPATNPPATAGPHNLAYVIYTSGSTGTPKGVMIQHQGVVNILRGTEQKFRFGTNDVWSLFHSFAFDFSAWEIWGSLSYGGRLVVADRDTSKNPNAFAELLIRKGITILNQTPSAFEVLQRVAIGSRVKEATALRLVIFGGEMLNPSKLLPWFTQYKEGDPWLVNMYGITECTVHVTAKTISAYHVNSAYAGSPIGVPIANATVFVVDRVGRLVPVGVPGELLIGGVGLARGYLNRPELTAERFVDHPFSDVPGARVYRTGDLVRWLPDGSLEFLGRVDDQVKIRGFRIEPGEIESVLVSHEGVTSCVVVAREDAEGDKRLVAYLTPTGDTVPGVTQLRSFLAQRLPGYMVPAVFVTLEELPLTPNGKVDRKALPAPDRDRPGLEAEFVAPQTPAEQAIARIWAEVLGIDRVGMHDNFFELGGDSILSIQVTTKAKRHGLHVTPRMIFEHQTVATLASSAKTSVMVQAEQSKVVGEVSLTPIQCWFFEQEDSNYYNQSMLLKTENLDAVLLEQALVVIADHHDALRLRFERTPSGWKQSFDENVGAGILATHDLSGLDDMGLWNVLGAVGEDLQQSLDLGVGPLIRGGLINLGATHGQRLLLVVHHLAVDGVSWRVLLEDLGNAYESLSAGDEPLLPPKTTSFKIWAEKLKEHASSPELHGELEYWTKSRANCAIPRDFDGQNTVESVAVVEVSLTKEETVALLRDVPRAFSTHINDGLLTALACAMREWTGNSSTLIHLEGHGREDLFVNVDLSRTIGWFTSIFPVEIFLKSSSDPAAMLLYVNQQLSTIPNKGVGYGILRYLGDSATKEKLAQQPTPEISFNYLGQPKEKFHAIGVQAESVEPRGRPASSTGRRVHLIDIDAAVYRKSLVFFFGYATSIHDKATIQRLAHTMLDNLRILIAAAPQRLSGTTLAAENFPLAGFSQRDWSAIQERFKK